MFFKPAHSNDLSALVSGIFVYLPGANFKLDAAFGAAGIRFWVTGAGESTWFAITWFAITLAGATLAALFWMTGF